MAKSQQTEKKPEPVPNLLAQLEQTFGWSEPQAIAALGAFMLNTEGGRALRHQLTSATPTPRAA
jgi:hypothetical protein